MELQAQLVLDNVAQINIQIEALHRLSKLFYYQIEKWEQAEPRPNEELAYLKERYGEIESEILSLLTLKQEKGLPL
jgi:hypothetical protein